MADLPPIKLTGRDFATAKQSIIEFISAVAPEFYSDFVDANPGQRFVDALALIADQLNFYIDQTTLEMFLATCLRYSSALRHAKSIGYKPRGPSAASVDVEPVTTPSLLASENMSIQAGQQINAGALTFEVVSSVTIPAGTTSPSLSLVEGETFSEQFTATGKKRQTYKTTRGPVIDGSWEVTVNGTAWDETEFIASALAENKFAVDYDGQSRIEIRFGDGENGNIPALGDTIVARYRIGGGALSNVARGAVTGSLNVAYTGGTTEQITFTNPSAATGGQDRETLEEIRKFAPLELKTVDKAITKQDYDTLAANFSDASAGAIAKAVALLRFNGPGLVFGGTVDDYADLPIVVNPDTYYVVRDLSAVAPGGPGLYQWDGSTWNKATTGSVLAGNVVDMYVWAASTTSNLYGNASSALKTALLDYLRDRSVVTVTIVVRDGITTPLDIDLGDVYYDPRFDPAALQVSAIDAIRDIFRDPDHEPGSAIRISEIYRAVKAIDGINYLTIQSPTADVVPALTELIVPGNITATFVEDS